MDLTGLFIGGGLVALLTSCWGYIKGLLWKFCQLFVQKAEFGDDDIAGDVIGYLVTNYKKSKLYDRHYGSVRETIRPLDRISLVAYELFGRGPMVFWDGLFPIFYSPASNTTGQNATSTKPCLMCLRGTIDMDRIVGNALKDRREHEDFAIQLCNKLHRRFFIKKVPAELNNSIAATASYWYKQGKYRPLDFHPDELGKKPPLSGGMLNKLIFPAHIKGLIEEVKLWIKSKDWFKERDIPWKKGWLLYGLPGTGKSVLVRAFGEDLDLPIFVYNLAQMTDKQLGQEWTKMQSSAPCIALIEDIDNVFHGRENITEGNKSLLTIMKEERKDGKESEMGPRVNFDTLLNCLDGVDKTEGVFTVITTNHIDKVDNALGQPRKLPDGTVEFISTRPGRIDKAIELGVMTMECKKEMAQRILGEFPEAMKQVRFDLEETAAQFQERCAQLALREFWKTPEKHPLIRPQVVEALRNGHHRQ